MVERLLWFAGLVLAYFAYLVFILEIGDLGVLVPTPSLSLPVTLLAWAGPVYLWFLWRNFDRINRVEIYGSPLPFIAWGMSAFGLFGSVTGFVSLLSQLALVAVLGGIGLLRFARRDRIETGKEVRASVALLSIWTVASILVAAAMPPIHD